MPSALIACPSVTPARGEVFDVLEAALDAARLRRSTASSLGEAPDGPVENLVAIRGTGAPHFGFAGHLDVVPPGEGWTSDPFEPTIEDGVLTGRGANDMKSAIAAFVAALSPSRAAARHALAADHRRRGRPGDLRHAARSSTG